MTKSISFILIIFSAFAATSFPVLSFAQTNLPTLEQVKNLVPPEVNDIVQSVQKTVSAPNLSNKQKLTTQDLILKIQEWLSWLDQEFQSLTGISFAYLFNTTFGFLIWLIKLVASLAKELIQLIASVFQK